MVYTFDFLWYISNGNSDLDFADVSIMINQKEDWRCCWCGLCEKQRIMWIRSSFSRTFQGGLVSVSTAADRKDDTRDP